MHCASSEIVIVKHSCVTVTMTSEKMMPFAECMKSTPVFFAECDPCIRTNGYDVSVRIDLSYVREWTYQFHEVTSPSDGNKRSQQIANDFHVWISVGNKDQKVEGQGGPQL